MLNYLLTACQQTQKKDYVSDHFPKTVTIQKTVEGFTLYRNGKPFYIKGVGGYHHIKELKEMGGNSIRIWDSNDAERILDQAHQQGLTVMLGLWIVREREGFNYFNSEAVNQLKERIKEDVIRYRNHPALLVWCLGNELEGGVANARVWQVVNELAVMVHELDPNHPITMAVNAVDPAVLRAIKKGCPAIELLSINVYAGLPNLAENLRKSNWNGPYIISEFSSQGYWEANLTAWKAPIEATSSQKAQLIGDMYKKYILPKPPQCLGSYAFFWGSKQECTPTWFSIFSEGGEKSAVADMLQYRWTGRWPTNRAPVVSKVSLMINRTSTSQTYPGKTYHAEVFANDLEGDVLTYKWEVLPESDWATLDGGVDREAKPLPVNDVLLTGNGATITLKSPLKPGPYRLFVYVLDGKGGMGTANIAFLAAL